MPVVILFMIIILPAQVLVLLLPVKMEELFWCNLGWVGYLLEQLKGHWRSRPITLHVRSRKGNLLIIVWWILWARWMLHLLCIWRKQGGQELDLWLPRMLKNLIRNLLREIMLLSSQIVDFWVWWEGSGLSTEKWGKIWSILFARRKRKKEISCLPHQLLGWSYWDQPLYPSDRPSWRKKVILEGSCTMHSDGCPRK